MFSLLAINEKLHVHGQSRHTCGDAARFSCLLTSCRSTETWLLAGLKKAVPSTSFVKHQNASASSSRAASRGANRSVIPGGRERRKETGRRREEGGERGEERKERGDRKEETGRRREEGGERKEGEEGGERKKEREAKEERVGRE